MKLIRTYRGRLTFSLDENEKRLLFQVLQLYPLVPPTHHRLSENGEGPKYDENQHLLEEALAQQRRENRRKVVTMLDEPGRFRETTSDIQLWLSSAQVEWLLQVLNDVRVGAWLALGEPDELGLPDIDKENAAYVLAMEGAGYFESVLLTALGVQEPTQTDDD